MNNFFGPFNYRQWYRLVFFWVFIGIDQFHWPFSECPYISCLPKFFFKLCVYLCQIQFFMQPIQSNKVMMPIVLIQSTSNNFSLSKSDSIIFLRWSSASDWIPEKFVSSHFHHANQFSIYEHGLYKLFACCDLYFNRFFSSNIHK